MGKPSDLVQGTLDLLILKTISLEPFHGWAIARRIQQVSGEVRQVRSSIPSPPPAASRWSPKPPTGARLSNAINIVLGEA